MTGNPTPWLVLLGIVVAVLAWKGYLKLPAPPKAGTQAPKAGTVAQEVVQAGTDLARLTSHELGVLMALAVRREAEHEVAGTIAKEAADRLRATFSAPSLPAAPAPADPIPPSPGV